MSDHKLAENLRHLFHRNPDLRPMQGRMRLVTSYEPMQQYHLLEQAMTNSSDLVLATGCGLPKTVNDLPVRFPSLIVPGLELMRSHHRFFGKDRNITYHVYQAGDFIRSVNKADPENVNASARFMKQYLQEFTETYFADIAAHVYFDFNKNVHENDLSDIKNFIRDTDDAEARGHINTIQSYAKSDYERGCALTYAAANVYFNTMQDHVFERPTTIMPIGGKKEEPFFYLTSCFAKQQKLTVLPVTFNCQTRPPYYPVNTQDLTVGKLNGPVYDARISEMENASYLNMKDYQEMLLPLGIKAGDLAAMAYNIKNNVLALV